MHAKTWFPSNEMHKSPNPSNEPLCQGQTDLANRPGSMKIFPHSKFEINRTSGLKVMAKKLLQPKFELIGHNSLAMIHPELSVWNNLKIWWLLCKISLTLESIARDFI